MKGMNGNSFKQQTEKNPSYKQKQQKRNKEEQNTKQNNKQRKNNQRWRKLTRILGYCKAKKRENVRRNGIMNSVKYHREINKTKLKKKKKKCLRELALFQVFGDLSKNSFSDVIRTETRLQWEAENEML